MPNHVTNTLHIYAWHDDHDDLITGIRELIGSKGDDGTEKYIDFEKIIPPPDHPLYKKEGLTAEERASTPDNWYDWNVAHWGTKWNAYCQSVVEQDNDEITLQFDTAWSPPEPVIARLKEIIEEKYPESEGYEAWVSGSWLEEGYQSAGVF